MDTVGLRFANGWRCPKCGHQEVDPCSVGNWDDVKPCPCDRCKKARVEEN